MDVRIYDVRTLVPTSAPFRAPTLSGFLIGLDDKELRALEALDALIARLKLATDSENWSNEKRGTIEAVSNGYLSVKATPEMHARLRHYLRR